MQKIILKIGGMSCSACQNRVEKYLNKQKGVEASVNLVMAQALINYDETIVSVSDLERFIKEAGYKSLGEYNPKIEEKKDHSKVYLIFFGLFLVFFMFVSMGHMVSLPTLPYLNMMDNPVNYGVFLCLLTCFFLGYGFDILKSGIRNLLHKSPNMDTLVTIGVLASFLYSLFNLGLIIKGDAMAVEHLYFESVAMIIYFIKLGRYIDNNSKEKTKDAIKDLVRITPEFALLKEKDKEKEVTIDEVKKGDTLICKAGMKVAVDGVITGGTGYFDEAFITGESKPTKKKANDKVVAGSINLDGYIEYKAEKIGPDSTISEIVRLVVEATSTKAPVQKLADKVSGYFVPGIITIAILTLLGYLLLGFDFSISLNAFVTVLVVACPCALGLATPLAMVVSLGTCAKKGILIKKNETIETLKHIDTVVFDKTGTLTYGKLKVASLHNYSNFKDDEILALVSSLENNSTHPIASAFKEYYNSKVKVTEFQNLAGLGITGKINQELIGVGNAKLVAKLKISNSYLQEEKSLAEAGNSILYVIRNNKIIALLGVKDIVRSNASLVVANLKKLNKEVIMLSGDNETTAKAVAKELGIANVKAGVLPKEKESFLQDLKNQNHQVMMVGDGINDAPSLAASNIGVSLGSGTDIASSAADIILIQNDLARIVDLFKVGKKTMQIIKENLFWAFIYNILMIPVAIGLLKPLGISISPMIASIAMTISSLTVVLNSLRLRKCL